MLKVVVEGGLGEGKSSLALEIARLLEREGFPVQHRDPEAGRPPAFNDHVLAVERMKAAFTEVIVTTSTADLFASSKGREATFTPAPFNVEED